MPAFQRAVELGYRYLETDVHVTADGVVVAFHDDDLTAPAAGAGQISELPWRECRRPASTAASRSRAGGPARGVARRPHQHRLQGATGRRPAGRRVTPPAPSTGSASARSSDRTTRRLRERLGRGCARAPDGSHRAAAALRLRRTLFDAARSPSKGARPGRYQALRRRAHRRGLDVHVWTIDDPAEMHRLLDLGVDGIMTDRPAVLRDVLQRRRQWIER